MPFQTSTEPAVLDQSISVIDNVEHVFQRNLPAGQYALEVSSDSDGIVFGLAWDLQLGPGPAIAPRLVSGLPVLDLSGLDPFVTYTIQRSDGFGGWSDVGSVRTIDTVAATAVTWSDPAPLPPPVFYRLRWTAIR